MEKDKLLIGLDCMEHIQLFSKPVGKYQLVTTELTLGNRWLADNIGKEILVIPFSEREMMDFIEFYHKNRGLVNIGVAESSLIFVAMRDRIPVCVKNPLTRKICASYGIEVVKYDAAMLLRKANQGEISRVSMDIGMLAKRLSKVALL